MVPRPPMTWAILAILPVSFAITWAATYAVRAVAPRVGFVDRPGGRKVHANAKPLGGGVAIFAGVAVPLAGALVAAHLPVVVRHLPIDPAYVGGAREQTPMAVGLLAALAVMHALGLVDDRRPLGPYAKLGVQLAVVAAFVVGFDVRALTFLDHLGLGRWPSVVATVV